MSKRIVLGAGAAVLAAAGGWLWFQHSSAAAPADPGAVVSAQVRTVAVRRQDMALTVSVPGELVAGKVAALSFAQAGQLVRLDVVAGQAVRRGAVLALLEVDPAAHATYEQAVNALAFAQREVQRNEDMFKLQLATRAQLDTAQKQLQDAGQALQAQRKTGAAQQTIALTAPFDAVVLALPVQQGERLAAGAVVLQLGRNAALRLQLALEPGQGAQLRAGMPVSVTAANGASAHARLSEIGAQVDPRTQAVGALAELPAASGLMPGMQVQASIETGRQPLWPVPRQAVLSDAAGAYLYQVAGGKARRVAVVVRTEAAALLGVEGALDPALPVVSLGNYELQDGMAVRGGAL